MWGQPDITWAGHFTAAMADRRQQTDASWKDLPLPDQFPEPHTEGCDGPHWGKLGGTSTSKNTEQSAKNHPHECSPNLLLMLKAAESWRMPHGRDREREETARPELLGEAQRTDMVSET